jgi:predicted acetyltransferase
MPELRPNMPLELRKARPEDFPALQQMLELYQYDISDIYLQDTDSEAKYGYKLERYKLDGRFCAYVALESSQYIGFALVAPAAVTLNEGTWMEQFFITKRYRRSGAGRALALHAIQNHPGPWEIGQMPTNYAAQAFWRKVIATAFAETFVELQVTEGWWKGVIQQFSVPARSFSAPNTAIA